MLCIYSKICLHYYQIQVDVLQMQLNNPPKFCRLSKFYGLHIVCCATLILGSIFVNSEHSSKCKFKQNVKGTHTHSYCYLPVYQVLQNIVPNIFSNLILIYLESYLINQVHYFFSVGICFLLPSTNHIIFYIAYHNMMLAELSAINLIILLHELTKYTI